MFDLKYQVVRFIHIMGLYIASKIPWFFLFLKELCSYYVGSAILGFVAVVVRLDQITLQIVSAVV